MEQTLLINDQGLMQFSPSLKIELMSQAFDLALASGTKTEPGPAVGAVLAMPDGKILAQGNFKNYGASHAEEVIFQQISKIPAEAALFVSLEPCSMRHNKKSCCELILEHKVQNVVYGCIDQNPLHCGRGIEFLKNNNVKIEISALEKQARAMNRLFFHQKNKQTAFLAIKVAISLDAKLALSNGVSQWITNEASRDLAHSLRAFYHSVLIGKNTYHQDNPRLSARGQGVLRQPTRILLSSKAEIIPASHFATDKDARRIIVAGNDVSQSAAQKLEQAGIELIKTSTAQPKFAETKKLLFDAGVKSILLEGGSGLITNAYKENEIDYIHACIAPILIGNDGIPLVKNLGETKLMGSSWELLNSYAIENDLYVEYQCKPSGL